MENNQMTNLERLRHMSAEELASVCEHGCPPGTDEDCEKLPAEMSCQDCWLAWLKSPARDAV